MSPLMGSHGVATLATAMAAVSGTVILIAICRPRPLSNSADRKCNLRPSCISSDERKLERGNKKKKRVRFAKDAVVESSSRRKEEGSDFAHGAVEVRRVRQQIPANRVALYNGILQDRVRRMACSS